MLGKYMISIYFISSLICWFLNLVLLNTHFTLCDKTFSSLSSLMPISMSTVLTVMTGIPPVVTVIPPGGDCNLSRW